MRVALFCLLLTLVGWARPPVVLRQSDPLPTPDSSGNYPRSSCHPYWLVLVDQLNGRKPPDLSGDPQDAPVQRTFPKNFLLTAGPDGDTQTGFFIFPMGKNGETWMRVLLGEGPQDWCLVRAHRDYIRPVLAK